MVKEKLSHNQNRTKKAQDPYGEMFKIPAESKQRKKLKQIQI